MKRTKAAIRKAISLLLGIPLIICGLILIPLPGPGVLLTFVGLFVLSYGFESVKRPLDTFRQKLEAIYKDAKDKYDRFVDKHHLND